MNLDIFFFVVSFSSEVELESHKRDKFHVGARYLAMNRASNNGLWSTNPRSLIWRVFLSVGRMLAVGVGGPFFFWTYVISMESILERQASFLGLRHGQRGWVWWEWLEYLLWYWRKIKPNTKKPSIRILSHLFFTSIKDFIRNKWPNFTIMQV